MDINTHHNKVEITATPKGCGFYVRHFIYKDRKYQAQEASVCHMYPERDKNWDTAIKRARKYLDK